MAAAAIDPTEQRQPVVQQRRGGGGQSQSQSSLYSLGDAGRPEHMAEFRTTDDCILAVGSLKPSDPCFVRRSGGIFTFARVLSRTRGGGGGPGKGGVDGDNGGTNIVLELQVSDTGATKTVPADQFVKYIRPFKLPRKQQAQTEQMPQFHGYQPKRVSGPHRRSTDAPAPFTQSFVDPSTSSHPRTSLAGSAGFDIPQQKPSTRSSSHGHERQTRRASVHSKSFHSGLDAVAEGSAPSLQSQYLTPQYQKSTIKHPKGLHTMFHSDSGLVHQGRGRQGRLQRRPSQNNNEGSCHNASFSEFSGLGASGQQQQQKSSQKMARDNFAYVPKQQQQQQQQRKPSQKIGQDKLHKSCHDFGCVPKQQKSRRPSQTNGQARHNESFQDFQSSKPSSRPLGRKSSLHSSFQSGLHRPSVPGPGSPKHGIRREAGIFISEPSEGPRRSSMPDRPGQFNPNNVRSEAARDHGHASSFHASAHSGMSRQQPQPSSPRASKPDDRFNQNFDANRPSSAARRNSSAFRSSISTLGGLDESMTSRVSSSGLDESTYSLRTTGSRSSCRRVSWGIDLDSFDHSSVDDTVSCDGGNSGAETDSASNSDEESPAAVHPHMMDKEQIDSVTRKVNLPGGFDDVVFNERSLLSAFGTISLRRRPSRRRSEF